MGETQARILVLGSTPGDRSLCSAIQGSGLSCDASSDPAAVHKEVALGLAAIVIPLQTGDELVRLAIQSVRDQPMASRPPIVAMGRTDLTGLGNDLDVSQVISLGAAVPTSVLLDILRIAAQARRARLDLHRSELQFEQFMRNLPGLAWIKELDGRYRYANQAAENAFRTPAAALYGKRDEDVFARETARAFIANDRRVLAEQRALLTRETLLHDDGRVHHSIVTKFPIPGPDGALAMIGGMAIDITEWKEAEIAEALLAAVVESSEDAMISMTLDGTITSWNAAAEQLYGYSAEETIGGSITLVVLPEHHESEHELREGLRRGERIEHYETVRQRKDGRLVDISVTMSPIRDRSGAIVGASKVARDITTRKHTENALRRSEERFRLLAETAPCFVWTAAADGTVQYVNQSCRDYAGLDPALDPRELAALVLHPDDLERCAAEWSESLHSGAEYETEVRIRRFDGAYRWFVVRAVPLRGDDDAVIAWFGITVDVHDHKTLTEKLREADRHKNEFLATLGHELRNPLAPIQHSIDLLRLDGTDAPSRDEILTRMERQVHHLVRLVDDLLQISRVSRGRIELRPERADLGSIVHGAVETSRPLIDKADHEIELDLPDYPVPIEADTVRLEQMIANLLNNAAKFTDPGGRITIKALVESSDAVISVRDTGRGISAHMLPRIFEMFTQGDTTPGAQPHAGLGIGLALVKILAELHGGTITASSAGRDQGSEFVLRLPIVSRKHAPEREPTRSAAAPHAKARVLVVDDNQDAAETLGMLLHTLGHDVVIAHDGHTALGKASVHHPDVVLLDIAMPGIDGYEVGQRLKKMPELKSTLLIALSGYSEDREALQRAGFDAYFVKPVDFKSLVARLSTHLTERQDSNGPGMR